MMPLMVCHECFAVLPVAVRFCIHCNHPTPRTIRKWEAERLTDKSPLTRVPIAQPEVME